MSNFNRIFGPLNSPVPMSYLDDNFSQLEAASTSTVSITGAGLIGFLPSGIGGVATDLQTRGRQIVYVTDFAANGISGAKVDPTGVLDSGSGIQAAINAVSTAGGGEVTMPDGTYSTSALLTIPTGTILRGNGPARCRINSSSASGGIKQTDGVRSGVRGIRIVCSSTNAGVRGLWLVATTSNPQQPQGCDYDDVHLEAGTLTAGQIGLYIDASAGGSSQATFNHFSRFIISNFDRPHVEVGANEGNIFSVFHILTIGAAAGTSYGIESASNNSQYLGMDFRRGSSGATTLFGFRLTGSNNVAVGFADIGTGSLYSITGSDNQVLGEVITPTTFGTYTGGYSNPLGRSRGQAGGYEVTANSTSGANRTVFQAGVAGANNGFTIDYTSATGLMTYAFAAGSLVITKSAPSAYQPLDLTNSAATGYCQINLNANVASVAKNAGLNWAPAVFYQFYSPDTTPFQWSYNGATIGALGPGLQLGTPTGGDKGSGTVNAATGIYLNNSLLLGAKDTSISTGVGSVRMKSANAATNAAWIPITAADGTVYYVPGWTTNNP